MWQCKHCDAHIDIKMHDNYLVKAYNVLETFIIIFIFYKIHIFMPKIIWGENSMLDTGCKKQWQIKKKPVNNKLKPMYLNK